MKQCLACGRRYGDSEVACPKCYSPEWTLPLTTESSATIASTSYVCQHCITLVEGGTAWCPNCGQSLAPGLLKLFCMIGVFGSPLVIAFIIYTFFTLDPREYWGLPDAALCLAAIPIFLNLGMAKSWSWYAARVLIIASLVAVLSMTIIASRMENYDASARLAGMLVFRFIGLLPLWVYLDTRDLREYCGIVFKLK
jgi:RNA polymerase subunit RPABC4/transcription elongation factor Spt4